MASGCDAHRYCAWTGGYFTGPSINFYVGSSYNWSTYAQAACATSGTSGRNWNNCASSTRNRSTYSTANYFALPGGNGYSIADLPNRTHDQLGVFNNNIDSSVAL